jgi:hypothetical protein
MIGFPGLAKVPVALGPVPLGVLLLVGVWLVRKLVKLAVLLLLLGAGLTLYLRLRHGA